MKALAGRSRAKQLAALLFAIVLLGAGCETKGSEEVRARGVAAVATVPAPPLGPPDPRQSVGMFVGVSSFEDGGLGPLRFAVNDAIALAEYFVLQAELLVPDRVHLYLAGEPVGEVARQRLARLIAAGVQPEEATVTKILRGLEELPKQVGPQGLLAISVSSHGFSVAGQQLLAGSDSVVSLEHGVSSQQIEKATWLENGAARILILDACRDQIPQHSPHDVVRRGRPIRVTPRSLRRAGPYLIAQARKDGFSYEAADQELGMIVASFLAGLRGGAADDRGAVTLDSLASFGKSYTYDWMKGRDLGPLGTEWIVVGDYTLKAATESPPFPEIGEILEPVEGALVESTGFLKARIDQPSLLVAAVIRPVSTDTFFVQNHGHLAPSGGEVLLPVNYGGPGQYQVYLGALLSH